MRLIYLYLKKLFIHLFLSKLCTNFLTTLEPSHPLRHDTIQSHSAAHTEIWRPALAPCQPENSSPKITAFCCTLKPGLSASQERRQATSLDVHHPLAITHREVQKKSEGRVESVWLISGSGWCKGASHHLGSVCLWLALHAPSATCTGFAAVNGNWKISKQLRSE